jgi:RNA polymerase sigma factor (TIGR02999 family)
MDNVSELLAAIDRGDPRAADQLLPLVYDELRQLAAQRLAREKPGQTLEPTALVHEAYVRLVTPLSEGGAREGWNGRGHFFAAAALAMRRILVDRARRKHSGKHGGGRVREELNPDEVCAAEPREDLVALDEALTKLAAKNKEAAELVQLRYFAGLPLDQAAEMLEMSARSAGRLWSYARAWLRRELEGDAGDAVKL